MNWLFLRGLLREKRHWGDFPELFEKKVSGAKVFLLDHPGIGDSQEEKFPESISEWVLILRKKWQKLDIDPSQPSFILGHSLGGMVALKWADLYPKDFKGLVALNTSAANVALPWKRLKLKNLPSLLRAKMMKDPFEREKLILSLITRIRHKDNELVNSWAEIAIEPDQQRKIAINQLLLAMKFHAPASLTVPTLLLASKLDDFTDFHCSRELSKKLNSTYFEHAFAGHDLCLDAPHWTCRKINIYLDHLEKEAKKFKV